MNGVDGGTTPGAKALTHREVRDALLPACLIGLSALLVYSNTLEVPFQFDDTAVVANNGMLRDWSLLWPPAGNRWLGYVTFALNYHAGGGDVTGYHLANLAIHTAAASSCTGCSRFR